MLPSKLFRLTSLSLPYIASHPQPLIALYKKEQNKKPLWTHITPSEPWNAVFFLKILRTILNRAKGLTKPKTLHLLLLPLLPYRIHSLLNSWIVLLLLFHHRLIPPDFHSTYLWINELTHLSATIYRWDKLLLWGTQTRFSKLLNLCRRSSILPNHQ